MIDIGPVHLEALEKLASFGPPIWSPNVGELNPSPTVSQVLNAINLANVHDVGTSGERRDAFGRIINSGLYGTSPAQNALRMIGGGILGRVITSAFTNNGFMKGVGTGVGAVSAISRY